MVQAKLFSQFEYAMAVSPAAKALFVGMQVAADCANGNLMADPKWLNKTIGVGAGQTVALIEEWRNELLEAEWIATYIGFDEQEHLRIVGWKVSGSNAYQSIKDPAEWRFATETEPAVDANVLRSEKQKKRKVSTDATDGHRSSSKHDRPTRQANDAATSDGAGPRSSGVGGRRRTDVGKSVREHGDAVADQRRDARRGVHAGTGQSSHQPSGRRTTTGVPETASKPAKRLRRLHPKPSTQDSQKTPEKPVQRATRAIRANAMKDGPVLSREKQEEREERRKRIAEERAAAVARGECEHGIKEAQCSMCSLAKRMGKTK